jgi:hypothetical protein
MASHLLGSNDGLSERLRSFLSGMGDVYDMQAVLKTNGCKSLG